MSTLEIQAHSDIVRRFEKLLESDKLAHAYLFIGPRGIGKKETALAIAKTFSSEIDTHIYEVEYGERLKIEMVRELLGQIKLRPFNSERKVFILKDIDTLTLEAANSLLKTLEEPSKNSLLILTTSTPENVLDTIKSRCQSVYFLSFSPEETAKALVAEHRIPVEEAHFLSHFAGGNSQLALRLWEDQFIAVKNAWLDEYLFTDNTEQFIKKELKDKETQKIFLDVLMAWIRDALLVQCKVTDNRIIHQDRLKDIENFQDQITFSILNQVYQQIITTYRQLNDNLNIKMSLLIIREYLREF